MNSEWKEKLLPELAIINPKRNIQKGCIAPYIEMATLSTDGSSIPVSKIMNRVFTGGGSKFKNGDTLVARITPCLENGKAGLVTNLHEDIHGHGSTEFIVLAPKIVSDTKFLFYLTRTDSFRQYAIARMEGTSGRQRVPIDAVSKYRFFCPSVKQRKKIGEILSSFDDYIGNLRETNAKLEAIAQALFKSWFIDFDPVRAKAKGRIPEGIDAKAVALFPDRFEESELGLIPKGWKVISLGEATSYISRGISPKYTENGGIIVVNQKCIRDNIVDLIEARRHDSKQRNVEGRKLLIGDILVNSTGIGTLGRVAQILSIDEPLIVDSHITVVRAGYLITWNYLGLALFKRQSEIEALGEGSTGQTELSKLILAKLRIVIPNPDVLHVFDLITLPLREKFSNNLKQIKILSTLRDTLLPRLISGQLRLPEIEKTKRNRDDRRRA